MKGIIQRETIKGVKPYVPGKPIEELQRETGISSIIKLASNENALGPSPLAMKAINENIKKINYYPDANSYYLKQKLARKLLVSPEEILITNGSNEALSLFMETYINPGEEGIMGNPSFPEYERILRVVGGVPVKIPVNSDFALDLEAMLEAVNKNTRIIFLCSPNNPTGTIIKKETIKSFLKCLPDNILVIIDEAYLEYIDNSNYFNSLDFLSEGYPVVLLRTFSKIYGLAALRIGYAIASQELINPVHSVREPFNVNFLAQVAAIAALDDVEHVTKTKKMIQKEKKFLEKSLLELGLSWVPTEANFIFVNLGVDSKIVFEHLLQRGVIIRTGDIYGYPNFARVTIGTHIENQRFIDELTDVLALVS
jgi:histidinol-phosphate aminotransferase